MVASSHNALNKEGVMVSRKVKRPFKCCVYKCRKDAQVLKRDEGSWSFFCYNHKGTLRSIASGLQYRDASERGVYSFIDVHYLESILFVLNRLDIVEKHIENDWQDYGAKS